MYDQAALWQELADLDLRRQDCDRRLREASDRQRYMAEPGASEAAKADERRLVLELDRVMTRIRSVEGKLLLARQSG